MIGISASLLKGSEALACETSVYQHVRVPVRQVITEGMGEAYLRLKLRDQARALELLSEDPALAGLRQLRAPLVDLEVRGLPALQYFGGLVWQDAIEAYAEGPFFFVLLCLSHCRIGLWLHILSHTTFYIVVCRVQYPIRDFGW